MSEAAFILIVEDEKAHGEALVEGLRRTGHACHLVESGQEAVRSIRQRGPDVVLTDYRLGGEMNGLDVLRETKRLSPDTEVILITAYGSEQLARDALSRDNDYRAYDYVIKPLDIDLVREKVNRAARQALTARENRMLREQLDKAFNFEGIIGTSEAMSRVIHRAQRLAETMITVLIIGESGTGKELIARAIHINSPLRKNPLQIINCAAFNENLLESELFGHVKGAFTGAIADHKGKIEAADGGTLFLDEVGDMPLAMQAKLLRVLENGEVCPVGSTEVRRVKVRVIAATHQELKTLVENKAFREDLYYRLHQVAIRVPPLRERREDIPLLVHHFIRKAAAQLAKEVTGATPEVVRKLTHHQWPGNVRELRSTILAMVTFCEGELLTVADLPDGIRGGTEIVPAGTNLFMGLSMSEVEKIHIANTLRMTGGNREQAAKVLGIGARTLYRKLKEFHLS